MIDRNTWRWNGMTIYGQHPHPRTATRLPTMASPSFSLSSHERTRVEDYLNDKIQISADFESLDSLLATLRAQHELQRKQVERPWDRALQLPKRLTFISYLTTADRIA